MTAPYPTPGEFPDFEHFMIDLFTPISTVLAVLPSTGDQIQSALPFLWVRTMSGGTDVNAITYTAKVRVVAVGQNRDAAQQLAARAREALLSAPGKPVNGVLIDWAEESQVTEVKYFPPTLQRSQGTADLPNLDPTHQLVELGFTLHARRQ
ncbi:phage tail termination protein [Nocardia sp. IFM 10818]